MNNNRDPCYNPETLTTTDLVGPLRYAHDLIHPDYQNGINVVRRAADYIRYMENRVLQAFTITGGCETIDNRRMLQLIQRNGYGMIAPFRGKLYFFAEATLGGQYSQDYRPTMLTGANPFLGYSYQLRVNDQCALIRNDTNLRGYNPIFSHYGILLAENEISMSMASINARIAQIIIAGTDSDRKAAQLYLDDIRAGKPGVMVSRDIFERMKISPNPQQASILTDLIEFEQYLKAAPLNEIGLSANYNMKREAINSQEAQIGSDSLLPLMENSLITLREDLDRVNEMYGELLDQPFSIDFAGPWLQKAEAEQAAIENPEGGQSDEADLHEPELGD